MDIHTQTASELFKVPQREVTAEQRDLSMTLNFGKLYGSSLKSSLVDALISNGIRGRSLVSPSLNLKKLLKARSVCEYPSKVNMSGFELAAAVQNDLPLSYMPVLDRDQLRKFVHQTMKKQK
jgi:hypothetical protein